MDGESLFSFSRFVLLRQEMCKGHDFAEENEARAMMKGKSKQGGILLGQNQV